MRSNELNNTYKVYQIQLSDADVDMINDKGHNSVPHHKAKLDMQFNDNMGASAKDAFDKGYYTHVANITTDGGLEGVFHVGNMGPEESIERLTKMHSVSVADIVEGPDGIKHVVAGTGFQKVD
jgi:hypothetical protein